VRNLRFLTTLVPRRHVTTTCLIPDTGNFSFMVAIYIQITQLSCDGASTRYVAVFCRILPYSTSHILPSSTSHILPSSASHILPNSASHILPNSASHILPNSASYILLSSASHILPNSASHILLSSASHILLSSTSHIRALAALAISPTPS